MKKFAMVLVVLSAMLVIVNCAKKEEVVQQPAPVVETPAPVEEVPAVVDSAAVAVDSAAAVVEETVPAAK